MKLRYFRGVITPAKIHRGKDPEGKEKGNCGAQDALLEARYPELVEITPKKLW